MTEITVAGVLARDDAGWSIESDTSKQHVFLGESVDQSLKGLDAGARIEVTGDFVERGAEWVSFPTLQLEGEVPYQKASFEDGTQSGSGTEFGNTVSGANTGFIARLKPGVIDKQLCD